ncbi:hypothetical protein J6590_001270 [Homalodisca vitripennis]|nr:hypothetical protein J6590_001270 [Homalodisca vitripennis]
MTTRQIIRVRCKSQHVSELEERQQITRADGKAISTGDRGRGPLVPDDFLFFLTQFIFRGGDDHMYRPVSVVRADQRRDLKRYKYFTISVGSSVGEEKATSIRDLNNLDDKSNGQVR